MKINPSRSFAVLLVISISFLSIAVLSVKAQESVTPEQALLS